MNWKEIPLPTHGLCPPWALDAFHMYLEGRSAHFSNKPQLHIKVPKTFNSMHKYAYEFNKKGYYLGETSDGLAECHYHSEAKEWSEIEQAWLTPQSEGYGGKHFRIQMVDGSTVILRGPWHGIPPEGYNDVITHDLCYGEKPYRHVKGEPGWFHTLGCFGTLVSDKVYCQIVAKFLPHLRVAQIQTKGRSYLTLHHDGQPPKGCTFVQKID